jgi:2'-5' RNA ligase
VADAGDSGVVVLVPDADPLVGSWRLRYDPAAAQGMPAHITLLHPFLPDTRLDHEVTDGLRDLLAPMPAFDLELRRTARFPETIYLEPEPDDPFRRMTAAIAAAWPEAPPYGGMYPDVIPHLTVADRVTVEVMDEAERAVGPALPVCTRVAEAHLFVFDGDRWQPRASFPLGG